MDTDTDGINRKSPWSPAVLAAVERVQAELLRQYPPADVARVSGYLDSMLSGDRGSNPLQSPSRGYFPGLSAKPWWAPRDTAPTRRLASVLEAAHAQLLDELKENLAESDAMLRPYRAGQRYRDFDRGAWRGCTLYTNGRFTRQAETRFPFASRVLSSIRDIIAGEAVYLHLAPGTRLPRHTDSTNATLSCHLGMIVPEGCGLDVAGEVRSWREGEVLVFDHSFVHSAWNESEEDRYVLLVDVHHPELEAGELELLEEARLMVERILSEQGRGPTHGGDAEPNLSEEASKDPLPDD